MAWFPSPARWVFTVVTSVALLSSAAPVPSVAPQGQQRHQEAAPLVIGHRGASAYRPEHTLASYELAARMGADYLEVDLVSTKDGVLVARHENEISGTTDVADRPEFADRRTTRIIDGWDMTGWFTEDFTLAELRSLRVVERQADLRQRNTIHDGRYRVPTLQEVIDLSRRLSRELRREIGIYAETKHPTYFASIGLALEPPLVRILHRNGLNHRGAKVFLQSFEVGNLMRLDRRVRVPLIQLVYGEGQPPDFAASGDPRTYQDLITPSGLAEIARYADGIGPEKTMVVPVAEDGTQGRPTPLVDRAHAAGLLVHAYTFAAENAGLPATLRSSDDPADYGRVLDELATHLDAGVDGVFTDNPDLGVVARADR